MITFEDILKDYLAALGDLYHAIYKNREHLDYYFTEDPEDEKTHRGIYRWGFDVQHGLIEVYDTKLVRNNSLLGKKLSSKSCDYKKTYRLNEPVSSLETFLPTEIVVDIVLQLAKINARKHDFDDRELFIPKE